MNLGATVDERVISLFSGQEEDAYSKISPMLPPYEHQRRAVNEAYVNLKRHGFHALFMEMGTGKTKTTIDTWMAGVKDGLFDAMLIVAPKTLLSTWSDEEIPKHLSIPYEVLVWDGKKSPKSEAVFSTFLASSRPVIYIVNVEAFQSLNETLRGRVSQLLRKRDVLMVVDESSYIKGHDAKRSKNIVLAGKLAEGRLILTGTEISKSPLDMYMQFEFLFPGLWGVKSYFMFRARYAILEDAYGAGGRSFKKIVGYQKLNEMMDTVGPFITRAMKKDCLDMPDKVRVKIKVGITPTQNGIYQQLKRDLATLLDSGDLITIPNKISLFTKFRQIVGGTLKVDGEYQIIEPRPEKLVALLDDLEDTDEQAIIWCAFRGEVQMIMKALERLGTAVTFDGSTSIEQRNKDKLAFQSGQARFFVGNMKAGSFGLNLQNCHLQYFYSRDTSPQANWQAEDRSHRPGQKNAMTIVHIKGSPVEERLYGMLRGNIENHEKIIDLYREMVSDAA
jgi:SNF2 family DNA or RNA helicase